MSESRKLIKKAVLAGVGASSNAERIKSALDQAMADLVKVGQDLFNELEDKGKVKTENVQHFMRNLQDEASKRTQDAEKKVSSKVGDSTKKYAKELGLATRAEIEEVYERLAALEEHVFGAAVENHDNDGEHAEASEGKKRSRKKNG